MFDKGKLRGKLCCEKRERGFNEKEREKIRTAGTETRIKRRTQCDFDTGAKSP